MDGGGEVASLFSGAVGLLPILFLNTSRIVCRMVLVDLFYFADVASRLVRSLFGNDVPFIDVAYSY